MNALPRRAEAAKLPTSTDTCTAPPSRTLTAALPRTAALRAARISIVAAALLAEVLTAGSSASAEPDMFATQMPQSACNSNSGSPGSVVGSVATIPHSSGPIQIQIVGSSPGSDAYVRTISIYFAVRGDTAAPTPAPVMSAADVEQLQNNASAMPSVIKETRFLSLTRAGSFRCDGLPVGRYHALALVPRTAPTSGMFRSAGKTMTVTDYYTTDFVVPQLPGKQKVVVEALGFRRIGRSPAGF